ncbi:hypothetical protein [Rhizobium oryzicola]|uniref:Uncharacterized protein n=1 Tax=Rhizobium oryzicola TaxID=1232668 RepID=A0ABT8SZ91_9HYPH|nr:hypothetical protein [Rhizobium oryzicola]MDO1583208.1 hypothetical protein [Rhizobium oryzicola]
MSSVSSISNAPIAPQIVTPDAVTPVGPAQAVSGLVTSSVEDQLAAALALMGGPNSSVGLSGLYRAQSPGDISVLLAEASLTLQNISDEAKAEKARLAMGSVVDALTAYSAVAQRQTELDAKADAAKLQSDIATKQQSIAEQIAALEAITDPDQKAAVAPQLANLKSEMVSLAQTALAQTAALLQRELDRLPDGDRSKSVADQLAAVNLQITTLAGPDAYSNALSALAANDVLLVTKIQDYDAAANAIPGISDINQAVMAIAANVATVFASINALQVSQSAHDVAENSAVDRLLSDILQAAAKADASFIQEENGPTLAAQTQLRTARQDDAERTDQSKLVDALLMAAVDLLLQLSTLESLTIQEPQIQPGRSRLRVDV